MATEIMTSHIWTFQIFVVWMVQVEHYEPLDCIYNLSSWWKGLYIWLLARHKQSRVQALWKLFEIVSDGTYSFTINILVEIVVDTSGFSYNAYKKYVKDPNCYDRRSKKKKIKNGMKLKLRREFPVSTNTTTTALLLILHLLLYSTLVLLLLLLLLLLYSTLLTTTSSTTPTDCLLYML
jgi:hypothetical protein